MAIPPWQIGVIRPTAGIFAAGGLVTALLGYLRNPEGFSLRSVAVVAMLLLLGAAVWRRTSWRPLTILTVLTLTLIGATTPSSMGLRFSPMLVSALAVTIAASLLGWRTAMSVLSIIVASLLVTGYGVSQGWFVIRESSSDSTLRSWIQASVIFAVVASALAVVVSSVVRSLQLTLALSRRSLEQLRISEERLAFALRGADDALWDRDFTGGSVWYSPRWKSMFGYGPQELPTGFRGWEQRVHPDDVARARHVLTETLSGTQAVFDLECRVQHKDGHFFPVLCRGFIQRNANGEPVRMSGTCSDLTERTRVEIERKLFERNLQETQKLESLGVLAGGIAHDFNNLLTGVLGNASLAAMDTPPESHLHEYLTDIQEAAKRASDLCRQMLAYSGRGRFVVSRVALGALVRDTTQLLQFSISKNATLRFQLTEGLPLVEIDATQVQQVIMNLVINASEALGDVDGTIAISTERRRLDAEALKTLHLADELEPGDFVCLTVADTGAGMSPETQARIFDPFFTTKFTGRGLGLAAVLGIVRGHRGGVTLHSEPGGGSTFTVCFPAVKGDADVNVPVLVAPDAMSGEGTTVLVVDDEESVRRVVVRMLGGMGFATLQAGNGAEAVKLFREGGADVRLVILDLTMPTMDGERALVELRRLRPDVRVVLMSGFYQPEHMVRSASDGLASFVQKPFSIATLQETVRRALAV